MSTAMMQAPHSDSEDEDAGQVPELLNTIKGNIDAHDALDQMPADKYDEAAEKIFKETGDYLSDEFMKPDDTDFSEGAMDARKNNCVEWRDVAPWLPPLRAAVLSPY